MSRIRGLGVKSWALGFELRVQGVKIVTSRDYRVIRSGSGVAEFQWSSLIQVDEHLLGGGDGQGLGRRVVGCGFRVWGLGARGLGM